VVTDKQTDSRIAGQPDRQTYAGDYIIPAKRSFRRDNNDTKDYSEQLEFLNSKPYYASKKMVNQSSDFPVRRTGAYRHKKSTGLFYAVLLP